MYYGGSTGRYLDTYPNEGIFRYSNGKLYNYVLGERNKEALTWVTVTENGDVWATSWNEGIFRYDRQQDKFVTIRQDHNGVSLLGHEYNMLCRMEDNIIMALQTGGLHCYNTQTRTLSVVHTPELRDNIIRTVHVYDNQLWIGSYDGVFVMNDKLQVINHLRHDGNNQRSMSDGIVYCTYEDRNQGIWIGTMYGGVNYLPERDIDFHVITPINTAGLQTARIRELAGTGDGRMWLGTETEGFYCMNLNTHQVAHHDCLSPNNKNVTLAVASHDGQTLLSYFKSGVEQVNVDGSHEFFTLKELGIKGNSVYALLSSRRGGLWVGTDAGLYYSERGLKGLKAICNHFWCFGINESMDGTLWISTMGSGVYHYNPVTRKMVNYRNTTGAKGELSSNSVSSITEDSKGRIWLSTDRGGLCLYDSKTNKFTRFSTEEGLPDNNVYKVLEDKTGKLWFGTNHGLVRFNPENHQLRVFTTADGLPGNEFNYKSAISDSNGNVYFGTTEGIVWFNPMKIHENKASFPIYLSRMIIFNREVSLSDEDSPLKQSLLETSEISLPYNRASFSFDVALLNYASIQNSTYEYMLEPIDREWTGKTCNQSISFANLAPGKYILHLRARASKDGGEYVTRDLTIRILPPWYGSTWAYLIYIILFACVVACWFRWYRRRKNRQLATRQHLFEVEKEKELFENKVTFFTSIAHEIRTPLSLIAGPLEVINHMNLKDTQLLRNLHPITQNVERLLTLATQLLDFQRLGSQQLHIQLQSENVSQLLRQTYERFAPSFTLAGKSLSIGQLDENIMAMIDKEAIIKIFSNLINNAFKYSTAHTTISLTRQNNEFKLCVTSDGQRIPNQQREEIFTPFVQLDGRNTAAGGIGIGLGMARSLALLHHGTLELDSHNPLNSFVLTIPCNLTENAPAEKLHQTAASDITADKVHNKRKGDTLLIVEDNEEILSFIRDQLSMEYAILSAHNGVEAIQVIEYNEVNLVITDLMMPEMDGFALCEHIKQDAERSQIPVIILTAKDDIDSKIKALDCGAESYIEKPFSILYLSKMIHSLLDNRHRERVAFSKRPFLPENSRQVSQEDKELVTRIVSIVNEHLKDEDFNVEVLAGELCMSRSSLLRKIKSLFNIPPLDLIRLIRLKRAAELIQSGGYRLGEISSMVGINSPSYFGKLFVRQFGMTPKEFEKQVEQKRTSVDFKVSIDLNDMLGESNTPENEA